MAKKAATTAKRTLKAKDLGPIEDFDGTLPERGVYLLSGRNGSGKSTLLQGVAQLLGSDQRTLSARDDTARGTLELGEARLTVTRAKSRAVGALEVVGCESRFDINDLVDPGIIDPEAADNSRMKTLVSISGRQATEADFLPLANNDEILFQSLNAAPSTDPIVYAGRVKAGFERIARGYEAEARKYAATAEATRKTIADIDTSIETGEQALADAYAEAREALAVMERHNENAAESLKRAQKAKADLDELATDFDDAEGLRDLEAAAQEQLTALASKEDELAKLIQRTNARIEASQKERARIAAEAEALRLRRSKAERVLHRRTTLAEEAAADVPAPYTPGAIGAAKAAVAEAQAALSAGAIARKALETAELAEHDAQKAKDKAKSAEDMRARAHAVDGVLCGMLPEGCPLRYVKGRLVIKTERDDAELYADLSDAEKWRVAIDVAAAMLPSDGRGLLTLSQPAWEAQDPQSRKMIRDLAIERNLLILTAVAADSELTGAEFVPE